MLNDGNQIHNFISSSGSGTVIIYVPVPTFYVSGSSSAIKKLRFLRFRFHNTDIKS